MTQEEYTKVLEQFEQISDFHTEGSADGVTLVYRNDAKITGFKNTYEAMKHAIEYQDSTRQMFCPFPWLNITRDIDSNNQEIIKETLYLLERYDYFYSWQDVIRDLDSFVYVYSDLYDRDYVLSQLYKKLYE